MKTVSPYLNFPGHTLEAFEYYQPLIDGSVLMGSDAVEGFGPPLQVGNNFGIAVETDSASESDTLFGKLSAGGEVTMPLDETSWAERFGMCRDRYGVQWMLNFTGSKQFKPA